MYALYSRVPLSLSVSDRLSDSVFGHHTLSMATKSIGDSVDTYAYEYTQKQVALMFLR